MYVEPLLAASADLREAARGLGRHCLDHEREILHRRAGDDPWFANIKRVEDLIAQISVETWDAVFTGALTLPDAVWKAPAVADAVGLLETSAAPLAEYAVLRGLARSGLRRWFEQTTDVILLQEGDPIPVVERPITHRFKQATPRITTPAVSHLLERTGFRLLAGATAPAHGRSSTTRTASCSSPSSGSQTPKARSPVDCPCSRPSTPMTTSTTSSPTTRIRTRRSGSSTSTRSSSTASGSATV